CATTAHGEPALTAGRAGAWELTSVMMLLSVGRANPVGDARSPLTWGEMPVTPLPCPPGIPVGSQAPGGMRCCRRGVSSPLHRTDRASGAVRRIRDRGRLAGGGRGRRGVGRRRPPPG